MRFGISDWHIRTYFSPEEYCPKIREIGYVGLDVAITQSWTKPLDIFAEPYEAWRGHYEKMARIMKENDLVASQTHATMPQDFLVSERFGREELDQFEKEIEATAILGAPYIVIHPMNLADRELRKEEDFQRNMENYALLLPILEKYGVRLAVENMFLWKDPRLVVATGCSMPEDMIRYVDGVGHGTRACLDTGHMNLMGVSVADAVRALGGRLAITHIHDNFGISDEHMTPSCGTIDWIDFAKAIKEIGFEGILSLEIDCISRAGKIAPELVWAYAEYAYKVMNCVFK